MPFIHLHNHFEYSVADGLFSPKKWAESLEQQGFKGHALTDHGNMAGHLPFYKAMRDKNLLPILGCEFYYVDNPSDKIPENRRSNHIVLIAKNYDGYQNLLALQKLSYTDGFYFKPRIGYEWLAKYSDGLVCLTACLGGILADAARNEIEGRKYGEKELGPGNSLTKIFTLKTRFGQLRSIFGDDLYVEFQPHKNKEQVDVQREYYNILKGLDGFKHVVTNDCHYILKEHNKIQDALKNYAYKQKNDNAGESYAGFDSLWLMKPIDILTSFLSMHDYADKAFFIDGMKRTEEIIDKCANFELPTNKTYLPKYDSTIDSNDFFRKLTAKKLSEFLHANPAVHKNTYIERFKKEYSVITKYNLQDYFLIVWDLVRYAKSNGIMVGLGRGSAAGCLISYLLNIVRIDPIKFNLIFERFLNENRCENGELPDIDLDFESNRRDEIKKYIYDKYGEDFVCEIGTYGRMKLKTALLDFGPTLGVATRNNILKITTKLDLDKSVEDDLDAAIDDNQDLANLVNKDKFFEYSVREIIGQIKSLGIHPAGVIVSNKPIAEITPVKTQKSKESDKRIITTQSEDKHVINQGLVKLDILGIKEYDKIKYIMDNSDCDLKETDYVERVLLDEDVYQFTKKGDTQEQIWKMFQYGESAGIFQFSSDGMKDLLIKMKPDCINDLIAANALFRPGCLENGWHIDYCDRKHGVKPVEYIHEDLKEALKDTYGVIVFQEQFMQVFHKLGGIPLVDADTIRSALGKKDKEKLGKFKKQFITGAALKIGEDNAETLWEQIEKSSSYNFNKSHSAAYSVLAYISQYMKVCYPVHFWASQLEWDVIGGKSDSKIKHRQKAVESGFDIQSPDINKSKASFYVATDGKIIWPTSGVKGVGSKAAVEIDKHSPFVSFDDFYSRVHKSKVKWNNMLGLAYSGAFDKMIDRRDAIKFLYDQKSASKKTIPKLTDSHMMMKYYEHMDFFEQKLKTVILGFDGEFNTQSEIEGLPEGQPVRIGGILTSFDKLNTKNGDAMAFAIVSDLDETIEVTVFPEQLSKNILVLKEGAIVEMTGKKNIYNGKQNQIVLDSVKEVT